MTHGTWHREAWEETVKASTIINSFKGCGIHPINRNAVPREKILPSSVYASTSTSTEVGRDVCVCVRVCVRAHVCVLMISPILIVRHHAPIVLLTFA